MKKIIIFLLLINYNIFLNSENLELNSINIGFSCIPFYYNLKFITDYGYQIYEENDEEEEIREPYLYEYEIDSIYGGNYGINLSFMFSYDRLLKSNFSLGVIVLLGYGLSYKIPIISEFYLSNNIIFNSGIRFIFGEKKTRVINEATLVFSTELPYYPNRNSYHSKSTSTSSTNGVVYHEETIYYYRIYPSLNFSLGPMYKVGFVKTYSKFQFEFLGFIGSTFGFSYFNYLNKEYFYDFFSNLFNFGIEFRWAYHKRFGS